MSGCEGIGGGANAPVPWVGFYVALASLACCVFMAVDLFYGFRQRMYPFRSRYFSLNSTTLALLGIATKLPADLTSSMPGHYDQLSKLSGTALLCTAIANFMPSLIDMSASEAITNTIAVVILAVTVVVDVGIQMGTHVIHRFQYEHAVLLLLLLLLLIFLCSAALCAGPTKQLLQHYYDRNCSLNEANPIRLGVRDSLKFFWVTAQFFSPRYVFGYSEACTAAGALNLVVVGVLVEAAARPTTFCAGKSDYRWSTTLVLFVQAVTVGVGTIAPAYRWLTTVRFSPDFDTQQARQRLFTRATWTQSLREWESSPPSNLDIDTRISKSIRKACHRLKRLIVPPLIALQYYTMLACNLIRFVSIQLGRRSLRAMRIRSNPKISMPMSEEDYRQTDYIVASYGEIVLVEKNQIQLPKDLNGWIHKGARLQQGTDQPTHLTELIKLQHSTAARVEPTPLCWGLPIVTLAVIAVSLPGLGKELVEPLLEGVRQGLKYVKAVDEYHLKKRGQSNLSIRRATEKIWNDLNLYNRWLEEDLGNFRQHQNGRSALKSLKISAQGRLNPVVIRSSHGRTFSEIEKKFSLDQDGLVYIYMYKLSHTILEDRREATASGELFELLRTMVSENMAACFADLPSVIYNKCASGAIEDMEENICEAAVFLGEIQNILKDEHIERRRRTESVVDDELGSRRQDRRLSTSSNEHMEWV